MPYGGELEGHRALFHAGAKVLELGCATGRLTRRLLEWGARVTAVDNCPEMLSLVPDGASRVLSDIESLDIEQRFDTALLASCLINHPVLEVRSSFVDAARRHLRSDGHLLLERHDPAWLRSAQPGRVAAVDDIVTSIETVSRTADVVEMTVRYEAPGNVWRHSFAVAPLSEAEIEALLSDAGFGGFGWAPGHRWVTATVTREARRRGG